jgi:hypothetical protein
MNVLCRKKSTVEAIAWEFLKARDGSILAMMLSSKSKTSIKMRARWLPRPHAVQLPQS